MKKILLASVATVALTSTAAFAADMRVKAPIYKAPPPPAWSWAGFYLGANVGGSWGRATDTASFTGIAGVTSPIARDTTHPNGVLGGAQAGYNWQSGPVVFGIETDIQGSGQQGTGTAFGVTTTCGVPCSVTETDKMTWFGTTRGRLGYSWGDWMAYVTGGAAYGGFSTSGTENFVGGVAPLIALTNGSTTPGGWTVGGGLEGHLSGAWTWKVEYLHMDFGTTNFALAEPPPFAVGTITQSFHVTDDIVRVGVNYHLNPGGPVVARY